ncbi:hypothetical protein Sjap_021029 [Stephania japonica]|uniref:CAAX prenyl protease 2/Lysostaphin resistance protein A-like domain-containing protein n=1 Tax=Stephania japonica TaxID=461633 RepID=A0AAP0F4I4_9MAGN
MLSLCCPCVARAPSLLLPPNSRVRVSKQAKLQCPLNRSSRVVESHSKSSNKRCKVSCFRHDESASADVTEVGFGEDAFRAGAAEVNESASDRSNCAKKDFISSFGEAVVGVFRISGKPWTVPWSAETILQVMLLWIASFWFVGSWIIPLLAHAAGFTKESLTYRGQALYSLLTDVAEGLAGIAILHRCLSKFRPLPSDWFRFSLNGNWQFDVGLGCLMFPLVNRLSQVNLNLVPHLPSAPITISSVEQSIVARDPVAMALYAIVVSVCAPVWEEIVFRGFLLPSLTRYMPVWGAILTSSVIFALAHFNAQRMLPLIFLGVVMGAVFTRSKNLLASMLLHSLWNGFVFLDLMK